jgi:hypothetical protein
MVVGGRVATGTEVRAALTDGIRRRRLGGSRQPLLLGCGKLVALRYLPDSRSTFSSHTGG